MRMRWIKVSSIVIVLSYLISACAGFTQKPLANTGPVEGAGEAAPTDLPPTSVPAATQPTATVAPEFTPVAVLPHQKVACSPLSLDRSLILKVWEPGASGQALTPYDPDRGAPLCGFEPIPAGKDGTSKISPDGSRLAFSLTRYDDHHDGSLHFVDLKEWKDIPTSIEVKSFIAAMTFSPDNRRLAIALGMPGDAGAAWPKDFSLLLVDTDSHTVLSETTTKLVARTMDFTSDGAALMIYGTVNKTGSGIDDEAHALLLDGATLKPLWDQKLSGVVDGQTQLESSDNNPSYIWWQPAAVISAQSNRLFIVHADGDRLTSVDFSKRAVVTVDVQPKAGWLEHLLGLTAGVAYAKEVNGTTKQAVLSPDGARLYVIGNTTNTYVDSNQVLQMKDTYLGLQVIDTSSGVELAHKDSQATNLSVSADGKVLFLYGWNDTAGWTDILNTETLTVEKHLSHYTLQPLSRLDREAVVLSLTNPNQAQAVLAVFDPVTFEMKKNWWMWGSVDAAAP